jgi:hypothetical protein
MFETQQDRPEPADFRPESWRDVIGLAIALFGLALLVAAVV